MTATASALGSALRAAEALRMELQRRRVIASAAPVTRGRRPHRGGKEDGRSMAGVDAAKQEQAIGALVSRARTGDGEAFAALFAAFEPDVARLCRRLLGTREDAEDAASEAFLRARRSLGSYDAQRPFRSWLLSIAAHHAIDCLRRRSTERRLFAPAPGDLEGLASALPSPLHGELHEERRRQVRAAIDDLPDRYRAPLVLRYFAELDYAEIAEALAISRGQVGTLLFRARVRLRGSLDGPERA